MSNQHIRLEWQANTQQLLLQCFICQETVARYALEYLPTLDILSGAPWGHIDSPEHRQRASKARFESGRL